MNDTTTTIFIPRDSRMKTIRLRKDGRAYEPRTRGSETVRSGKA